MNFTSDDFKDAVLNQKIASYEKELIDRLRDFSYEGIPLSVVVLCFSICNRNCYPTSIYLTLGMDHFKLVHGDVNIYPKNLEYPNHSWVEKDGFVYDPTDGYKWEKVLYYHVFEPVVVKEYDEESVQNYSFYQETIQRLGKNDFDKDSVALILQYLELLEAEIPTVNHYFLLEEIEKSRSRYQITRRYSDQVMKKYREFMEEENKQHKK
ncbi:MAG: hypothetical protein MR598_01825 [Erysipelotrichaceae bacterium]|nr:hypothetical protein [Erysipelotrichaceae bacterium]